MYLVEWVSCLVLCIYILIVTLFNCDTLNITNIIFVLLKIISAPAYIGAFIVGIKQCRSNKTTPEHTHICMTQHFLARNNILSMDWPALSRNYKLSFQLHYSNLALCAYNTIHISIHVISMCCSD